MRIGIDIDNVISTFNENLLEEYIRHDTEIGGPGIVNKDVIKSMSLENNNSMNEIEQLRISNQKSIDELNMLLNKGLNDEQSNDVNNTTYVSQSSRERKANAKVLYNDSNLSQTNLF